MRVRRSSRPLGSRPQHINDADGARAGHRYRRVRAARGCRAQKPGWSPCFPRSPWPDQLQTPSNYSPPPHGKQRRCHRLRCSARSSRTNRDSQRTRNTNRRPSEREQAAQTCICRSRSGRNRKAPYWFASPPSKRTREARCQRPRRFRTGGHGNCRLPRRNRNHSHPTTRSVRYPK